MEFHPTESSGCSSDFSGMKFHHSTATIRFGMRRRFSTELQQEDLVELNSTIALQIRWGGTPVTVQFNLISSYSTLCEDIAQL